MQRVKIVSALRRPVPSQFFERVSEALLTRRRLHLRYLTRGRGEVSDRDVSPQRLVHYRNTWYLDAWCHRATRCGVLRWTPCETATLLDTARSEVPLAEVQAEMDAGYGIYAGGRRRWAVLHFDALGGPVGQPRGVASRPEGRWLADGRYELRLPYVDDTELVMDVLRQGEQVRVVSPPALVAAVRSRLLAAAALYDEFLPQTPRPSPAP